MEILKRQWDDEAEGLCHVQVGGIASDGHYRINAASVECDDPQEWLDEHQEEAQALIDVGQHDLIRETRPDFDALADKAAAEIEWLEGAIPLIETMTLEELRATLKRVARENMETLRAWLYVIRRLN